MPYLAGFLSLLLFWVLYRVFSGKWDLLDLAKGDNGLPSSSKFQFLIWTGVVLFSYVTIYIARAQQGVYGAIAEVPANLLILMGISSGAMVVSKGITLYHLSHGTAVKSGRTPQFNRLRYLIAEDDGEPALNKVQMIAWTFIAVGIYIFLVTRQVAALGTPTLPDVDDSLLVLMGISQGTYLGKRLVSSTTPTLQSLEPTSAKPGGTVTLKGKNLGDEQAGGAIRLDDLAPSQIKEWKNEQIVFVLPPDIPARSYNLWVIVGGKESNRLTLNVA